MSFLARSLAPSGVRASFCPPYRNGEQHFRSEFSAFTPSDETDAHDDPCGSPFSLDHFCHTILMPPSHPPASLLTYCPQPPFDCASYGTCLLLHSTDTFAVPRWDDQSHSTDDALHSHSRFQNGMTEPSLADSLQPLLPLDGAGGAVNESTSHTPLSPPPAVTADADNCTSRSSSLVSAISRSSSQCLLEYRRIPRGPLPPPPWPFFSRSTSHERTSWTSLSAAANGNRSKRSTPAASNSTALTQTAAALQPSSSQSSAVWSKRVRVCHDGVVTATLHFTATATLCPLPTAPAAVDFPPPPPLPPLRQRSPRHTVSHLRVSTDSWSSPRALRRQEYEKRREERLRAIG